MRVRLMHNPSAGSGDVPAEELAAAIRAAGHELVYEPEAQYKQTLAEMERDPGDMVVAVGGDGTIGRIARQLIGRGVPIALMPAGTANNLARAVGASTAFTSQLGKLDSARHQVFDVGVAKWAGNAGECHFLESAGGGLLARAIRELDEAEADGDSGGTSPVEKKRRAMEWTRRILKRMRPARWRVEVDGRDWSGQYLLVEAMNIPSVGSSVVLAPRAEVADGMLDVVLIGEDRRERLDRMLERLGNGEEGAEDFVATRGRNVVLDGRGEPMHLDDDVMEIAGRKVRLGVLKHGLTFVVT